MDDAQLLDQIRNGNKGAFKDLIIRYESLISATITGMLGPCSEIDDIGQEVFIRFYKAIDKFRGESTIGTYLTRIAINLSLNELKRRKRRHQLFIENNENFAEIADNSRTGNYDEQPEIVQQAIQKLEPKFRAVIVLRLIDGYSTEETAIVLKIPLGTVLSRLSRAQQKLKEILSPVMGMNDG